MAAIPKSKLYPATVHSRFKLAGAEPLIRGRQSPKLKSPRELEVEDKMVKKTKTIKI